MEDRLTMKQQMRRHAEGKGELYSRDSTHQSIDELKVYVNDLMRDSLYGVYALLNVVMSFEFYFLYSK